jgi:hypothetical protein
MNIEELMNVEVTSVSRHEQSLSKTAAIFVITEKDIQCSGATDIPDLLRMFPGVQVAQITASSWVYVPSFGGLLRTPERIAQFEVIHIREQPLSPPLPS